MGLFLISSVVLSSFTFWPPLLCHVMCHHFFVSFFTCKQLEDLLISANDDAFHSSLSSLLMDFFLHFFQNMLDFFKPCPFSREFRDSIHDPLPPSLHYQNPHEANEVDLLLTQGHTLIVTAVFGSWIESHPTLCYRTMNVCSCIIDTSVSLSPFLRDPEILES